MRGVVWARAVGAWLAVMVVLGSVVAMAADAMDTVKLKSGGVVRGLLVEYEPGQPVVIHVRGEERTIAWEEIEAVVPSQSDAALGADGGAAAAPAAADDGPVAGAEGVVRLHIRDAEPRFEIWRKAGDAMSMGFVGGRAVTFATSFFDMVCRGSCDRLIDTTTGGADEFRVRGEDVTEAKFKLGGRQGDVIMHIEPGDKSDQFAGEVLVWVGAPLMAAGIVLLVLPVVFTSTDPDTDKAFTIAGASSLAVGGGMVIGGGVLWGTSLTKITFESDTAATEGTLKSLAFGPGGIGGTFQ